MNTYMFAYCQDETCYLKKIVATSYKNAVNKACNKLESLNDELDLIGLDWDEVIEECNNFAIYVSNLMELEEL